MFCDGSALAKSRSLTSKSQNAWSGKFIFQNLDCDSMVRHIHDNGRSRNKVRFKRNRYSHKPRNVVQISICKSEDSLEMVLIISICALWMSAGRVSAVRISSERYASDAEEVQK